MRHRLLPSTQHAKKLIPAAYTPFNEDLTLDPEVIPRLAALYRQQKLHTVFICGTTGECASLTCGERERIAEYWVEEKASLALWIHVGSPCQADAIRLAEHARDIGAQAISSLAPYYFRPDGIDSLVDFLTPIAGAAPDLPFYFYEIPSMTGFSHNIGAFTRLAIERIPNFAGIKYSSPDLYALQGAMKAAASAAERDIGFFFGVDEMLLPALTLGINGAIGSTYNFAAPLYHSLFDAYERGELGKARTLQQHAVTLVDVFHRYGGIATGKAIIEMFGVSCGPVRPPLRNLSTKNHRDIYNQIAPLDIFPYPLSPATPLKASR